MGLQYWAPGITDCHDDLISRWFVHVLSLLAVRIRNKTVCEVLLEIEFLNCSILLLAKNLASFFLPEAFIVI